MSRSSTSIFSSLDTWEGRAAWLDPETLDIMSRNCSQSWDVKLEEEDLAGGAPKAADAGWREVEAWVGGSAAGVSGWLWGCSLEGGTMLRLEVVVRKTMKVFRKIHLSITHWSFWLRRLAADPDFPMIFMRWLSLVLWVSYLFFTATSSQWGLKWVAISANAAFFLPLSLKPSTVLSYMRRRSSTSSTSRSSSSVVQS